MSHKEALKTAGKKAGSFKLVKVIKAKKVKKAKKPAAKKPKPKKAATKPAAKKAKKPAAEPKVATTPSTDKTKPSSNHQTEKHSASCPPPT